jgi:predicted Zn-dependent protease
LGDSNGANAQQAQDYGMKPSLGQLTPESVERASGDETAPIMESAHGGVFVDRNLNAYVNEIGQRVLSDSARKNWPSIFKILAAEKVVNAFALGNGNVYVTRGLLSILDDEAELAFILGHEVGHVEKRHIAYAIDEALGAGLLLAIAQELAKGTKGAEDLVDAFGTSAAEVVLLGFGRERELEADDRGLLHSVDTGYDPYAAVRVFGKFQKLAPESQGLQIYMDSHPTATQRISDVSADIASKFPGRTGAVRADRYNAIVKKGQPYAPLPPEETAKHVGVGSSVALPIAAGVLVAVVAGALLL